MHARTLSMAMAMGVFVPSAMADAPAAGERPFAVGGFFGGNFFDDDIELGNSFYEDQVPDSAFLLGLRASYDLLTLMPDSRAASTLSIELEGKLAFSSLVGNDSRDRGQTFAPVFGLRAHAIASFLTKEATSPFVLVGVGAEVIATDSIFVDSPDADSAFLWGLGARHMIRPELSLRVDFRQVLAAGRDDFFSTSHEVHIGAGYHWGQGDAAPPAARDRDGDGLIDTMDECPDAPEDFDRFDDGDGCPDDDNDVDGIVDGLDKCPLEPEVINGIEDDDGCPERDADGDGILGGADSCPEEAEDKDGFEDGDGCPDVDNDNDGIVDGLDKCANEPETTNGFADDDGCPDEVPAEIANFTGAIKGIRFRLGSSKILRASHKALDGAVAVLKQYPAIRIEVAGHTDSSGSRDRNVLLSSARAASVKTYLVGKGIADDRLEAAGFGPDRPVGDNKTRAGRAQNRRIEFRLLGAAPATSTPPPSPTPGS